MFNEYEQHRDSAVDSYDPISVTQLNQLVKRSLESSFHQISVIGEIANFSRPMSGHIYFTLKDALSEVRCVFFRMHQGQDYLKLLKDGVAVELSGKVTLYSQRGQYQMMVSSLRLQGEGLLKQQFLELKKRLEKQGLFDPTLKKNIPKYPSMIGVISSPKAAGLDDFLTVLANRFPACHVRVFNSPVQGNHAAKSLIHALKHAQSDPLVDVIVFCRGGGSMEDLWCFNDEQLAHAIFACSTPIISAVGHEKDITICDLCADVRAATPTNAAMLVAPDLHEMKDQLQRLTRQLVTLMENILRTKQLSHSQISARIQHPRTSIRNCQLQLTRATHGLTHAMMHHLKRIQWSYRKISGQLSKSLLLQYKQSNQHRLDTLYHRLQSSLTTYAPQRRSALESLHARLRILDPNNVLKRGYAVIKRGNEVVSSSHQLLHHDQVELTFYDGDVRAIIESATRKEQD